MSAGTPIEWSDHTVNPVSGCSGCELWSDALHVCWSGHDTEKKGGALDGFAEVFDIPQLYPGRMAAMARCGSRAGKLRRQKNRVKPWLDGAKTLIFVSDMGDALSEGPYVTGRGVEPTPGGIPFEYLQTEIIDVVTSIPGRRHIWLWLTKRPGRMATFAEFLREQGIAWPENLWAGTSITSARTLGRVDDLESVGAAVSFLSVEPLVEEVGLASSLQRARSVRWVIVGGESDQPGHPARPFHVEWARRVVEEARDAGRAPFVKQLGSRPWENGTRRRRYDSHGGDWFTWPEDLRVRELPRQAYDPAIYTPYEEMPRAL